LLIGLQKIAFDSALTSQEDIAENAAISYDTNELPSNEIIQRDFLATVSTNSSQSYLPNINTNDVPLTLDCGIDSNLIDLHGTHSDGNALFSSIIDMGRTEPRPHGEAELLSPDSFNEYFNDCDYNVMNGDGVLSVPTLLSSSFDLEHLERDFDLDTSLGLGVYLGCDNSFLGSSSFGLPPDDLGLTSSDCTFAAINVEDLIGSLDDNVALDSCNTPLYNVDDSFGNALYEEPPNNDVMLINSAVDLHVDHCNSLLLDENEEDLVMSEAQMGLGTLDHEDFNFDNMIFNCDQVR